MKIHFAGGLKIQRKDGQTEYLRGWICCGSGDLAYKVREQGNYTMDKHEVTCKKCLNNIEMASEFCGIDYSYD